MSYTRLILLWFFITVALEGNLKTRISRHVDGGADGEVVRLFKQIANKFVLLFSKFVAPMAFK